MAAANISEADAESSFTKITRGPSQIIAASLSSSTTAANSFQYDNFKMQITPATFTSYYYNGTGNLHDLTSWTLNSDGSGSSTPSYNPTSFTADYQKFYILQNAQTTAAWTVSGASSKIILGSSSSNAVTLTVQSGFAITGILDIAAASSGSNSIILNDASQPTFGSLHANSEVHFRAKYSSYGATTFGKLFVDSGDPGKVVSLYGNPYRVLTSLTVAANSTLYLTSTTQYSINASGAAVSVSGTIRTPRVNGFSSSNITPGSSNGCIQFSGNDNITLNAGSTIEYSRDLGANSGTTQTISARSDYQNLLITGYTSTKVLGGNVTVLGQLIHNGNDTLSTGAYTLSLGNNASALFRPSSVFTIATGGTANFNNRPVSLVSSWKTKDFS